MYISLVFSCRLTYYVFQRFEVLHAQIYIHTNFKTMRNFEVCVFICRPRIWTPFNKFVHLLNHVCKCTVQCKNLAGEIIINKFVPFKIFNEVYPSIFSLSKNCTIRCMCICIYVRNLFNISHYLRYVHTCAVHQYYILLGWAPGHIR